MPNDTYRIDKRTIFLVVDDLEPMRKVTANQLRSLGAETILMASNGAEALRILQNKPVDIVLSDWSMPLMSGLDLLKAMRSDDKLAGLPFIMVTAEAERHRIEEAIGAGVSDLLVKPYTASCLASRVGKALTTQPRAVFAAPATFQPPAASPAPVRDDLHEYVRTTILIVDDMPDNLQLLSNLFTDEYRVRIAHNGDKALSICLSMDPPDLVLLDIMMPGMDGFEVAKRMRNHPSSENIPVIFVSAMVDEEARLQGMELGAVDFVCKPVDPDTLIPRVRNFLHFVNLRKQLQADYDGMLESARLHEDVELMMRHDMRGPLASVIAMLHEMESDSSASSPQFSQLRRIEETTLQVLDMINLSSELFKIEKGRFHLDAQPVMIVPLLRRIVEIARTTYAEKHLTVEVDSDMQVGIEVPQVLGDSLFCYSIFQNLLKNACEAAPDNSRVSVILQDETPLRILIQNKGLVPAEIRPRFFDKFVTHSKLNGTGIGTYSAKLLTEAQNGNVALDISEAKNLTTVSVSLPRYSEVTA
ncbi:ATP-binding response regulator [Sideroxydans sp.]